MKPIHLIVAVARNGVIGRAGRLPWDLPEDWQQFLDKTRGGILIHGRKCQDHHGPKLLDREVIVLSRNPAYTPPAGAHMARDFSAALALAQKSSSPGPVWIGGGAEVYRAALPVADKVHLTEIDADFPGDTFLPLEEISRAGFTHVIEEHPGAPGPVRYTFKVLGRK